MADFSIAVALRQKILPAITFGSAEHALPVAETLLKAGVNVMEIPFRTRAAAAAVEIISRELPEMNIGAGTLLTTDQVKDAVNAGARFGLSPGFNTKICEEANRKQLPFIPGVMTPSEIEAAVALGFSLLKLFPAEQIGGASFLKAVLSPYAIFNLQFIPMGGVNPGNMKEYLQLPNVIAVGGSWLATKDLIAENNLTQIATNVRKALEIASGAV